MFFSTDNSHLFFNQFNGNIYDVDCNHAEYLKEYLQPDVFNFFRKYNYGILNKFKAIIDMNQVWIQNKVFNDSLNALMANVSNVNFMKRKYKSIGIVTISITDQCNFRCKYCVYSENNKIRRNHSNRKSDPDLLFKILDYVIPRITANGDHPCRHLNFYGGEPLAEFDLMKIAIQKIRKDAKADIPVSLTTNGSLLRDEVIDFLVDHNIVTTISIDGPERLHNNNRVFANGEGSFKSVFNNIERFRKKYPKIYEKRVAFSVVVPRNIDINEFYDFFLEKRKYFAGHVMKLAYENTLGNESRKNLGQDSFFQKVIDFYVKKLISRPNEFNVLDFLFANHLSAILSKRRRNNVITNRICLPGDNRLFVNTKGDFFACESFDFFSPIGNIHDGFDFKLIKKMTIDYVESIREMCSACWVFPFCNLCIIHSMDGNGTNHHFQKSMCNAEKNYYSRLLSVFVELSEKKGTAFLKKRYKELPFE